MNKYYNQKTTTSDGIIHDSQREATRWMELKLMEKAGKIYNLRRQVKYNLIPKQTEYDPATKKEKVVERACDYIADFVYVEVKTGDLVVEDTKGMRTKDYIIKRKLMLHVHGIKIKEIE